MAEAASPSSILSASEISVAFGARPLLKKATLALLEGERVGLVGRNGCGKSTFLKIAAGVLAPDSGEINLRRGLLTGYLPQEFELEEAFSVHEAVLAGAHAVRTLLAEYETVPPASARAAQLLERIEHLDGWNLDARAKALLGHLNAPSGERQVHSLSGGEKRRVALARCLLAQPDLLILDEPTNHLDTESIQWLEEFLERYRGTCLFVTHDRYFLDRVCNRIVEIHQGGFESFPGNYTDFLITQAQREAVEDQTERRRQKFLKQELEWVRRAPGARRTKSQDRLDRYFEAAAQEAPQRLGDVELLLPPPKELGNRVVSLKNVSAKTGERLLFSGLTLELEANQRLGIVGRNGSGKTTLLRLLTQESTPAAGSVEHGARTEINLIDQHRLQIDPHKTVWDEVGEGRENVLIGGENLTLRAYLRRFLFQEEQMRQTIANLSGGERSRVLLAKILKRGGNVLVLDEPTNDLDLATLRVLEEALLRFQGTVVLVSHDRYFLNRVCTHILSLEGDASTVFNVGNYDDYLAFMAKRREREAAKTHAPTLSAQATPTPAAKSARPPKLTWKEERELESMENTLLEAESALEEADALLHSPDLYKRTPEEIQTAQTNAESLRSRVNALYARWEELEAKRLLANP